LASLGSSALGLSAVEAQKRLDAVGPNAIRTHRVRVLSLLWSQVRSPLLLLLAGTATLSAVLGQGTDAVIIGVILAASVGLGFVNEYRAARAAQALHTQLRHHVTVHRDGSAMVIDVADLVPGDVVDLAAGEVVPADVRLIAAADLECDESVLTGESLPSAKSVEPVPPASGVGDLASCALMGTVVRSGAGRGVVVATGSRAEFGRLALELGETEPETEFQKGLRDFSMLLVKVAVVLTVGIFAVNVALHRPLLEAVLFSLAIAVGISPQLLPAVVSTSLAAGSRELARQKVLVKRLVCIEDLGDVEVLFTDKTGTLTDGRVRFMRAFGDDGLESSAALVLGLVCNDAVVEDGRAVSGSALDCALWDSPIAEAHAAEVAGWQEIADHVSRTAAVLARDPDGGRWLVEKGAPESVLLRCGDVGADLGRQLDAEFSAGNRVIAVARAAVGDDVDRVPDGDGPLELVGILVLLDPPRPDAREALARLADLGIDVKVITGDNAVVAARVCDELGLTVGGALSGADIEALDDAALTAAIPGTRVFARVTPEQKARVVRLHRTAGFAVAFLGDGVNDAVALHAADVGISVDSATDVAKDAADVILLEKSLDVLATGVVEGRRVFANTIKYVLMGTSSNFGNMFSAAGASAVLSFLPMLPSQILLNNLLYDSSQLAIPTDHVDPDQLRRPSHWDIGMIRRFMLFFGPISSAFDFVTFWLMLSVLHATVPEFRAGWFVESLATQTLVIFAIRTRRVPFVRSRPSRALLLAAIAVVVIGAWIPASPMSSMLGFAPLPMGFYAVLVVLVVVYLVIIDSAKAWFFVHLAGAPGVRQPAPTRRVHRRASRFSTHRPLPSS
jgi:Mg2+-importing ATPase